MESDRTVKRQILVDGEWVDVDGNEEREAIYEKLAPSSDTKKWEKLSPEQQRRYENAADALVVDGSVVSQQILAQLDQFGLISSEKGLTDA